MSVNERSFEVVMTAHTTPFPAPTMEDRGHEILGLVRTAFAEKGFDGASMQDLARAAGMSVGNFYRYFPSKAAIVEAMCSLDLHEMEQDFIKIRTSGDPMSAIREKMMEHVCGNCQDDGQLWAEITAAAMRKPEIGLASAKMEETIIGNLNTVFAGMTGRTVEDAALRYRAQGQLLVMLVKAAAIRSSQYGGAEADLTALVGRIIDHVLGEISNDKQEG